MSTATPGWPRFKRCAFGRRFEISENARNIEKAPMVFEDDDAIAFNFDPKRSPGMMIEDRGQRLRDLTEVQEEIAKNRRMNPGKMEKLVTGMSVVYMAAARLLDLKGKPKACCVGKVMNVSRAEAAVVVHCHRPVSDGHLRLQWNPCSWKKVCRC